MKKLMKKALVGILAATMMFGSVCTAYAATGSATVAPAPTKQESVKADNGTKVNTSSDGKATVTAVKKTTKKSVSVASKVTVNGVKYTVTTIGANTFANAKKATKVTLPATITEICAKAFTGAKSVKTIVINSKKAVSVSKTAFKGVDTKKMTIKVTNMSKKQLKAFKANLKKAGFKGKVKTA